jgi:signal transduction histidine kinase
MRITVEDDGPGIPAAQRSSLLERGKRLDEMVGGHGLGLSIVHDIVATYEGRIRFEDAAGETGLRVVVVLPAERVAG